MVDELNRLQQYLPLMFWLELAGLLHDIGKLQDSFIEYRKSWQTKGGKDPHECDFLGKESEADALLKNGSFDNLHGLFQESFKDLFKDNKIESLSGEIIQINESIADLVKLHIEPENSDSELAKMLKAADGKDSAEDRNNPLLVNEQSNEKNVFKSSVFGYESPIPKNLDELRCELYKDLQSLLCKTALDVNIELREKVHEAIRKTFSQTINDTCRPVNDIVLWEHSYATATLFKVLIAHFILYGEKKLSFKEIEFSLWGVGWDGLAFYSSGQKISDIVGRKALIRDLKKKIREKVEWDFSLGNAIYDDDNGVYFIIPEVKVPEVKEGKGTWIDEVVNAVRLVNKAVTEDELSIFFSKPKRTNLMVPIVTVIEEVKQASAYPWNLKSDEIERLKWVTNWTGKAGEEVCPICRKRSLPHRRTICRRCEDIRKLMPAVKNLLELPETVYHSEIILGNKGQSKRLALIVARFDLKRWLDGTMLYSLFVKEARSLDSALKHLGKINHEKIKIADEERIKILIGESVDINSFEFNHSKIKDIVNLCQGPDSKADLARAFLFLFDRHFVEWKDVNVPPDWGYVEEILNNLKDMRKDVSIENYLVTKNHSPSRLLRIWNGTRDFFIEQSRLLREECKDEQGRVRVNVKGDAPEKTILKGEAELLDKRMIPVEIVKDGESAVLINHRFDDSIDWKGAVFNLTSEEFEKGQGYSLTVTSVFRKDVVRARTITASPDTFLAVVPAESAIELCKLIYKNYQREFGKMYGRLPLSIGVLYFNPQMPMFVALDGARRMIKNFEMLSQMYEQATISEIKEDIKEDGTFTHVSLTADSWYRDIKLSLPIALGNNVQDYFHPYFLIENGDDIPNRKSYFETLAGKIVHYLDLERGDRIAFYPNFFDFEFLDSTTRRFDLSGIIDKKRYSGPDQRRTRPVLLDELEQGIERLWSFLKDYEGMTDSKLRNLASLFHAWELWQKEGGSNVYESFIQTALTKELPNLDSSFITSFLREGLFFDVLELYLEILKERISR